MIAPDCDVVDTENGATITGDFTADLLKETINNTETGYRYNPTVTCGPYMFESFDEAGQQATLKANPEFVGDYRGVKPLHRNDHHQDRVLRHHDERAGSRHCGSAVQRQRRRHHQRRFGPGGGRRRRYQVLHAQRLRPDAVDCSVFPTDSEKVRQAIAYCLDRNEFARQYTGGYGSVVHSFYGLAQWEYQESVDWINENLNTYDMNVEAAIALLEEDGWTLNADGTPYSGSGVRYKDVNGELKPLTSTGAIPRATLFLSCWPPCCLRT